MKFEVGDKVKLIDTENVFVKLGSKGVITKLKSSGNECIVDFNGNVQHVDYFQLKSFKSKNKNKKRIKKLEKEVAELKLIVNKLCKTSKTKILNDTNAIYEVK